MSDHSNEVTEVDGAAEEAKEESVRSGTTDIEASPSARSLYEDDIVVWDENDAENPYNWSVSKRVLITTYISGMTFAVTFASSVFSTAVRVTAEEFHMSEEVATLGTSLFVLGWGIGPLIWGPLSELYGRTRPLFIGFALFTIFNIPVALAQNAETILICRFIQGVNACAPLAVVGGILADIWGPVERGQAITIFGTCTFVGPLSAPIIGGFIVGDKSLGWRWIEWITLIISGVSGVIGYFGTPETYAPTLLQRRAKKLRHQTKNWALRAKIDESEVSPMDILTKYLLRPIKMLIQEPILLLISIYLSLIWGLLYLFFTAYPYSFQLERHWTSGLAGLPFLSMILGVTLGAVLIVLDIKIRYAPLFKTSPQSITPEMRLPTMIFGAFILPIGLFWFGWTSNTNLNPAAQIISGVATGCGILMVFLQGLNYIIDVYRQNANSGIAANTMLRATFAAGFPLFTTQMYDKLGVEWGSSLLGFLAIAFIPAPILFLVYGARLRKMSKFSFK